ncbi:MAG: ankyrin repeat domain-containing protein [Planctomycetales bacterium]|nr:ankyrin repeat domain-containing protein [Planctomycetales bacterium]
MKHVCISVAIFALTAFQPMAYLSGQEQQEQEPIDFARDVLPLFRNHCFDCHGPKEQQNGFRLDRRADAMRGGTVAMIGPGNSDGSQLYLRLLGKGVGPQMPPDGQLAASEIEIIGRWIDEGAMWPDEVAGVRPATVPDPKALKLIELLRSGKSIAVQRLLQESPNVVKLKGAGGWTPLMAAVVYGDVNSVQRLIQAGADVNSRTDEGSTALHWAVDHIEKVRLLVVAGADVNAVADSGRTPLLSACGRRGTLDVARLLLENGADASATAPSYRGPVTPLRLAAELGEAETVQLLLRHGANVNGLGPLPYLSAVAFDYPQCAEALATGGVPAPVNLSLSAVGPPLSDSQLLLNAEGVKSWIQKGADVNAADQFGRTALMVACALDFQPEDTVKVLLEHGADVSLKSPDGKTALDYAKQRGNTPIVERLLSAGAQSVQSLEENGARPARASSVRVAVERSLSLIQKVDMNFLNRTSCISCHHNSLADATIGNAIGHGISIDNDLAIMQAQKVKSNLEGWRERVLQESDVPGAVHTASYILVGFAARKTPPTEMTDALARYLLGQQLEDGSWATIAYRPPIASSTFQYTACSLRGMKVYGPRTQADHYAESIERATRWLKENQPITTEDRVFQILGLRWTGVEGEFVQRAAEKLIAQQQDDGGWCPLSTLASDAYATGTALVALREAGIETTHPAYVKGVDYLMNTQCEDGSWHVRSRAIKFQPYFESGFPYGHDQWISVAATNWATMALIPAVD